MQSFTLSDTVLRSLLSHYKSGIIVLIDNEDCVQIEVYGDAESLGFAIFDGSSYKRFDSSDSKSDKLSELVNTIVDEHRDTGRK